MFRHYFRTSLVMVFLNFFFLFQLSAPLRAGTLPASFSETSIGGMWNEAVGLTFDANGRMYVWEKGGRVWLVENGVRQAQPLIDISPEVGDWRDFGLLGFAVDPDFANNGYIYLLYVVNHNYLANYGSPNYDPTVKDYFRATIGRVTRYTCNASDGFHSVNLASRRVLLGESASTGIPVLDYSHGVGSLVFGTDGTLLVSEGEGASFGNTDAGGSAGGGAYVSQGLAEGIIRPDEDVGAFRSQMVDSLSGKILRIDPASGDGIPGNPYYDASNPRAARSRVWALGVRNPFRFTLRPGTGSHNRADADPGVLYIGDVGWNVWEELDVARGPSNFGWPLYEGLLSLDSYQATGKANVNAPNPLYGSGGCNEQYFLFSELLHQATQPPNSNFPNPCNSSQQIPASIPKFQHTRPAIDWNHDTGSNWARTGTFDANGNATVVNMGDANSPVAGSSFGGNCSIGGVWYTGTDFPATYTNTYFHADYGQGWIRSFVFDANNNLKAVQTFLSNGGGITALATHPITGGLYYITGLSNVVQISYTGNANQPPIARASANKNYGPGPLTVQFTSSASTDPEGFPLTYLWNFGDGTTSTAANPSHTFTATAGVPKQFNVTLTVTDNSSATAQATVNIAVNDTPPTATITSPVNGSLYSMAGDTTYNLTAAVADAEQSSNSLAYAWQVILHHNDHVHVEPVNTNHTTTAVISPVGCDGNTYFYSIILTVTDSQGLFTTNEVRLYPNCQPPAAPTGLTTTAISSSQINVHWTDNSFNEDSFQIERSTDGNIFTHIATTGPNVTDYADTGLAGGTTYYYRVLAENLTGTSPYSNIASTTTTNGGGGLPSPWVQADVGNVGQAGSASVSGATFTISGSGSDIWNNADGFHFVYQTLAGDGVIIARVTGVQNTDGYSKAGLMWRESLDPASRNAMVTLTAAKGVGFQRRLATAGASTWNDGPFVTAPYWLKLQRSGTTFSGYSSPDGVTWTLVASDTLSLGSSLLVGLAVTAHNNTALATDTFDNVSVNGSAAAPTIAITSPANGATFTNGATVPITATVTANGASISKVEFYHDGVLLGQDTNAPYTFDWSAVPAGSYSLTAKLTYGAAQTVTSAAVSITVTSSGGGGLPSPWVQADVGNVGQVGSATFNGSVFTIAGSGSDIWNNADGFHFVYQTLAGDGVIIARVTGVQNTDAYSKAGLMWRESLDPASRNAMVTLTAAKGVAFQRRLTTAGASTSSSGPAVTAPYWIKLQRSGTTFSGYSSPDGVTWTLVASDTISLGSSLLAGLAVTAHNNTALATDTFDNVSVNGSNAAPTIAITSPANGATFTNGATVPITAMVTTNGASITKVEFYHDGVLLGQATAAPYTFNWSAVPTGSYSLTAKLTYGAAQTVTSAAVSITVTSSGGGGLPSPWVQADVGNVGQVGSATFNGSVFTIAGSGSDIWNNADGFHFVYQTLSGDGTLIARVTGVQNTDAYSKAGLMWRESLDPAARNAMVTLTAAKGVAFQRRLATAGASTSSSGPAVTAPYWIKLQRSGTTFSGYSSPDGVTWTLVASDTISLGSSLLAGLAVTAHNNTALATDTFDNVSVNGSAAAPTIAITSPANGATFTNGATVPITASVTTNGASITKVEFYHDGVLLGQDTNAPYTFNWSAVPTGTYALTAKLTYGSAQTVTSAAVNITVTSSGGGGGLPSPWVQADVGNVGQAGSATFNGSVFTVAGSGSDIWDNADGFHFVYQTLAGDGTIIARVTAVQNTDGYSKAGLMWRESLDPASRNAMVALTAAKGVGFQRRLATAGASSWNDGPFVTAPYWIKLQRSGTTFSGYSSPDGVTWTLIASDTLSLGSSLLVGLAVTAHNNTALATDTFDNVSVITNAPPSGALPSPWVQTDVGNVGKTGSATFNTPVFTIAGSGGDIWDNADGFHFVYQTLSGDGTLIARVTGVQNTDGYSKAGLMWRESLDPASRNAMVALTAAKGVGFQRRLATAGASSWNDGPFVTAPYWIKLQRSGTTFSGYSSPDGVTWTLIASDTLSLGTSLYVGLAVTAHNNTALATDTFDNVSVNGVAVKAVAASQTVQAPILPTLGLVRLPDGTMQVTVTGEIGSTYQVDGSTNLWLWLPIFTNLNTKGFIQFEDTNAQTLPFRFYRAETVPAHAPTP